MNLEFNIERIELALASDEEIKNEDKNRGLCYYLAKRINEKCRSKKKVGKEW